MKIAMITHGTRGDVQPFVSLALALMERGHEVTLGTPVNLMGLVEKCGVRASKLTVDSQAFMESPQGRSWLSSGNAQKFMKELGGIIHQNRDELIEDTLRVCEDADILVTGLLTEDFTSSIAEARKLPIIAIHFNCMRSNGMYANALVTSRNLPAWLNKATHALADFAWWQGYRDDVNHFRKNLGLAPTKLSTAKRFEAAQVQTLHAFSPSIAAEPLEYAKTKPVLGAIPFPDSARSRLGENKIDEELAVWLKQAAPPVFFGMGSMPIENPNAMIEIISKVSATLGVRAVIGAGWSRFNAAQNLPRHVRIVGAVDHGWLLPQCRAAVHHGGAGTVHAALLAGLPAVITSVFADQPFWGAQCERQGVGVHLAFKNLNEASLHAALSKVLEPRMKSAAEKMASALKAEPDAVAAIIQRIEAYK